MLLRVSRLPLAKLKKALIIMNTLEFYQQTYTYDIGNNLTALSHQANSNTWQQTLGQVVAYVVGVSLLIKF
jgi:hypothetical protein